MSWSSAVTKTCWAVGSGWTNDTDGLEIEMTEVGKILDGSTDFVFFICNRSAM